MFINHEGRNQTTNFKKIIKQQKIWSSSMKTKKEKIQKNDLFTQMNILRLFLLDNWANAKIFPQNVLRYIMEEKLGFSYT
jgi:hypothetical protein